MFEIQLFGDNDTITSSQELKVRMEFGSNDDRLIGLQNPRSDLTAADITAAFSDVSITKVVVGDKDSADFTGLKEAYREDRVVRKLDLT